MYQRQGKSGERKVLVTATPVEDIVECIPGGGTYRDFRAELMDEVGAAVEVEDWGRRKRPDGGGATCMPAGISEGGMDIGGGPTELGLLVGGVCDGGGGGGRGPP